MTGLSQKTMLIFQEVLRNLVKRYVAAMIRDAKTAEGLTEDNFKVVQHQYLNCTDGLHCFIISTIFVFNN